MCSILENEITDDVEAKRDPDLVQSIPGLDLTNRSGSAALYCPGVSVSDTDSGVFWIQGLKKRVKMLNTGNHKIILLFKTFYLSNYFF